MSINFKSILKKIFLEFLNLLTPYWTCKFNNMRQILMKRNIFFYYDKNLCLYYVKEKNYKMYFSDKTRGIETYSYGIKYRANQLIKTYNLELIEFKRDDLIVDCGANYGDLYTWLKIKKIPIKYISFEPSPLEFKCLELNCENQINNNIGLSNSIGISDFFLKSESGDSSIIEPSNGFTKKIKIKTTTLNNYFFENRIKKVKLLKLEAEGFEPEILQGSNKVLNKIEYIGVDGSPERGKKNDTTIEYAIDFLTSRDFEVIASDINPKFSKALFKNLNLLK